MAQPQHHQQPPPDPSSASSSNNNTTAQKPPIPPLTSISPSIFTPIQGDELLLPFTPPASRVARLSAKIDALDSNRRLVRDNMLALYRRECARLIREAQAEVDEPPSASAWSTPSEDDLDVMVANVMAVLDKREGGERGEQPPAPSAAAPPNFGAFVPKSRREYWTTQIEITISKGLRDLKGYDAHVAAIRKGYTDKLEREVQSAMDIDD